MPELSKNTSIPPILVISCSNKTKRMKKIIIIGATSGIGLEVARCYLKDGWQVGVAGRREEELEKIRLSAPGQVCTQTIDVTREDAPFSLEQLIMIFFIRFVLL